MTGEYRILRTVDGYTNRISYTVQIKKKWWIFSWWEYLRDETFLDGIMVFEDAETARKWALEFLKGRIVEEGK